MVLVVVLVSVFLAAGAMPLRAEVPGQAWKAQDEEAVGLILAGEYKKASRKLEDLVAEMVDRLGPGVGGKRVLGLAVLHRALAEAGLGEREVALWDWHVALNLDPTLADQDLSRFGEAGRFLKEHPLRELDEDAELFWEAERNGEGRSKTPGLIPPKARRRIRPDFPFGASHFRIYGAVEVQVIITEEGEVVQPVVVEDLDCATITYSALDALRSSRFRPAQLDGQPVAAFYHLTVNYRPR